METGRHNVAGRIITKALCVSLSLLDVRRVFSAYVVFLFFLSLSKSSWGAGLVIADIGSNDRNKTFKFLHMPQTEACPLLGVGGTCYTELTLNQLKQLGLDHQHAIKLARKLHAYSVTYANKRVTAGHAIESNNTSYSQVLGPGAFRNPPDSHEHLLFCSFMVKGTHGSSEPICLLFLK
eukprot:1146795-Pelagomonas_calceolata.AAC.2